MGLDFQSFLARLKNDLAGGYSGNKVRGWVGELLLSESVTFLGSWHHPFTQAVHNKHYFTHRYLLYTIPQFQHHYLWVGGWVPSESVNPAEVLGHQAKSGQTVLLERLNLLQPLHECTHWSFLSRFHSSASLFCCSIDQLVSIFVGMC